MQTRKTFLLIGFLTSLLFSSCKNKELELSNKKLEQANEELDYSSVRLGWLCDERLYSISSLAQQASNDHAKALYERSKEVDSVFQKVIEKDQNSGQYIIQQYNSLGKRYWGYYRPIQKEISPQTAKHKLILLEFEILDEIRGAFDSKEVYHFNTCNGL